MNDRTDNAQRLSKTRFFGALIFTGVGLTFCFFLFVGKPVTQPEKLPEIRRPLVDTVVAKPSKHRVTVRTQGTVEPVREIDLFAQVSGQVESVADYFRDGLFFSAGDILLELEKADYEFAILRAKAQVATATQRVAEERGRNLQAQREWQELDTHQANDLFLRRPQVRAAEAALEAALADVAAAELALERTTIRAPFNGRLERTVVDLGQFVATGSLLAEIYATDRVEIRLPVNDSQLRLLELPLFETRSKPYPQVTLSYKFGGETWRWRGEISRVEARIDTNSRVTFAIAEVTNPFERHEDYFLPLTPGLFVNATIEGKPLKDLIELPATALRGDNSILWVNKRKRLERLHVDLLRREQNIVWVRGIPNGTQVVTEQSSLLSAGSAVQIVRGKNVQL